MDISRLRCLTPNQQSNLRKAGKSQAADIVMLSEAMLMHLLGLSFYGARVC